MKRFTKMTVIAIVVSVALWGGSVLLTPTIKLSGIYRFENVKGNFLLDKEEFSVDVDSTGRIRLPLRLWWDGDQVLWITEGDLIIWEGFNRTQLRSTIEITRGQRPKMEGR